jgi:hypothetical protein
VRSPAAKDWINGAMAAGPRRLLWNLEKHSAEWQSERRKKESPFQYDVIVKMIFSSPADRRPS